MDQREGARFGKYRLLKKIAAGGMGEVHLAKLKGPSGFEKLVVIKRLLDHRQHEQKYIDMFFAEARVAGQLSHPNIVQVYEVGEVEGVHYIAMEYVSGRSLRRILDAASGRGDRLHPTYIAQIIMELCLGLAFAHNARHLSGAPMGLIHRDINPHNVLVSYHGDVKVIDFGIAKSELQVDQTQAGTIKGTVIYMSPEQSSGYRLDKRSDLFSVGICLYESLVGFNPFHKDGIGASLDAIRQAKVPAFPPERTDLTPFTPIVKRAMARDPNDRYADCTEFAQALQALLAGPLLVKPDQELGEYLRDLFADDIAEEERLLTKTELAEVAMLGNTVTLGEDDTQNVKMPPATATLESGVSALPDNFDPDDVPTNPGAMSALAETQPSMEVAGVSLGLISRVGATGRIGRATARLRATAKYAGAVGAEIWERLPPGARYAGAGSVVLLLLALLTWSARPQPVSEPGGVPDGTVAWRPTSAKSAQPEAAAPVIYSDSKPTLPPAPDEPPEAARRATRHREPARHRPRKRQEELVSGTGNLQLNVEPAARVLLNGAPAGSSLKLRSTSGLVQLGLVGGSPQDPFLIKIHYHVDNHSITYDVEADPPASVRGAGGIALGRTPLSGVKGEATTVLELSSSKSNLRQRVALRFVP